MRLINNMNNLITGFFVSLVIPLVLAAALNDESNSPVSIQISALMDESITVSVNIERCAYEPVNDDILSQSYLNLPGELAIELKGYPELPTIARVLCIPPRGRAKIIIEEIETHTEQDLILSSNNELFPINEPNNDVSMPSALTKVSDDGFWPSNPILVGTPAIMRGIRLINVNIFPLQYNFTTNETRFIDYIKFRLEFEGEGENEVIDPVRVKPSEFVNLILNELSLNPPPKQDDVLSGSYLYIVPQFNGVDSVLAPLIEWRTRQGHKVSVARLPNGASAANILEVIRRAYEANPPVEFVTLVGDAGGIENSLRLSASNNYGDFQYTRLDGNDALPDIAIGRLSAHTLQELAIIVNKIVSYESNPFIDNPNWFRQGLVVAGAQINGKSEVLTAKYARRHLLQLGWREVHYWYWDESGNLDGNRQVNFLNENFNWGISLLFYRAYQRMNNLSTDAIRNLPNRDGRLPFVIAISCDTGDFTGNADGHTEAFLRAQGGGIAAIGTATPMTNVMFNNIVAGGTFKGVYILGMHNPGWGLNWGKFELWRAYDGLDPDYSGFLDWNNLMGDAGTHLWTNIPAEITVEHTQSIALGQTYLPVLVSDPQNNEPIAKAQVCLWKDNELHTVIKTDSSGMAHFYIEPNALTIGNLKITVTKHNIRPYLGTISVVRSPQFLGICDWTIVDTEQGNRNGILNPNEVFNIQLNIRNSGEQNIDGHLFATLISHSEWIDINQDTLTINNPPNVGQSIQLVFSGQANPLCPDRTPHNIELVIWNDNSRWSSLATPISAAPVLNVLSVMGNLVPGEARNLNIRLQNSGSQNLPAFRATLCSLTECVTVEQGEVNYPAIEAGGDAFGGQPFILSTRPFIIPGTPVHLKICTEVNNIPLSAETTLQIGAPGNGDPLGPDEYGYYCFDSGDTCYEIAPTFNWIEIDPNINPRNFEGADLRLRDNADNRDTSVVVQLPFEFQYYGQRFNQLTICSNGWAAFGDQSELSDFRNTHIGQTLGPVAQLCVWWDNLMTTNDSRILTFYDQAQGRFIVEWSRMRRLLTSGQGALETFELILYDPHIYPTYTGDGIIDFQYLDVTNENRTARNDVPFCTIGISNLDDSGGLEYTYWNTYPAGAMPIQPRMAIRWTTAAQLISGVITGTVTDLETSQPVENAIVTVSGGYRATTNRQGRYLIDVLVGEEYAITAGGPGWNDTTQTGFSVAENETITVNFALRHPEIGVSINEIYERVYPGRSTNVQFELTNPGNGPLIWTVERQVIGEPEGGIGPRRRYFITGQMTQDRNLYAVAYLNGRFYVTGSERDPNTIYILDSTGFLINALPQPGRADNGITDLAWDGEVLWGSGERIVYGFNLQGEELYRFNGPYSYNIGITWDDSRRVLWICGSQTPIRGYDRLGNLFYAKPNLGLTITGLAYFRDDPDDCPLYIVSQNEQNQPQVYKLNPDTDSLVFVTSLQPPDGGQPCGAFITNEFGFWGWTLMLIMNDIHQPLNDRIDIYQLGAYTNWMRLDNYQGRTNAGSHSVIGLTLDASGLQTGIYRGEIIFVHNAVNQRTVLPVTMEVSYLNAPDNKSSIPDVFSIKSIVPNPFNFTTNLHFSLPGESEVMYRIYDINGRLVTAINMGKLSAGKHAIAINGADLSSGVYWLHLQSSNETKICKLVCLK